MHNKTYKGASPVGSLLGELFNRSISDIVGSDYTMGTPAVNITESDTSFVITLAAPGKEKADFDVQLEKDKLSISVKNKEKADQTESKDTYTRREYNYEQFNRQFHIPNTLDTETISAKYDLGILSISIDKTKAAQDNGAKTIEII